MSLEQLKADVAEFTALLEQAKSGRVKGVLTQAKAEAEREICNLEIKERLASEHKAANADNTAKRYLHELTDYGWDQSAKFVKLFITLNGVQKCPEEAVTLDYTDHSLKLHVRDLDGKDYSLSVNNVLHDIDIEKSYRKLKTDMVAIYLKKAVEGQHWDALTTIQKRLKEKNDNEMSPSSTDTEGALVNILKKMYNEGDSKIKRSIAKAWTESNEKYKGMGDGGPGDLFGV